jgi:hypothetical protein
MPPTRTIASFGPGARLFYGITGREGPEEQ